MLTKRHFCKQNTRRSCIKKIILTLKARNWHGPEELVTDYFKNNTTYFDEDRRIVYNYITNVIDKFSSSKAKYVPAKLQKYCGKVSRYLSQMRKKVEFLSHYEEQLMIAKKENQTRLTTEQSEIAGPVLTRKSIANIEKRALEEIDENTIRSAGATVLPTNTPRIQKEDYDTLKDDFDIKYRTTLIKSTPEAETIFKRSEEEEEENL
ncbi:unnamed protein product [Mucor hiemalis]